LVFEVGSFWGFFPCLRWWPSMYRIFRTINRIAVWPAPPSTPYINPHKTRTAVRPAVSPDDELCTQLIVMTCVDLYRDKIKVTCVSGAGGRKLDRIHNV
jgi:hypothetical protein